MKILTWFFLTLLLAGCSSLSPTGPTPHPPCQIAAVQADGSLLSRFAPVFVIEASDREYNRIGTPQATLDPEGGVRVSIDPDQPTVFAEKRTFQTPTGDYVNLVFRIHFAEVPGGVIPSHLTQGKNVGLIVVVTLDARGRPVLYTLVHTCGCYLAFVPTPFLPEDAYPPDWDVSSQEVYGETLPGLLDVTGFWPDRVRPEIIIRDATHRIRDIRLPAAHQDMACDPVPARLTPLAYLEALPLDTGQTTSFFEESGPARGYVKGSRKLWERLFMSWWALDWRIGQDKRFSDRTSRPPVFYTSLKPWNRTASDMRDFAAFLDFWQWRL